MTLMVVWAYLSEEHVLDVFLTRDHIVAVLLHTGVVASVALHFLLQLLMLVQQLLSLSQVLHKHVTMVTSIQRNTQKLHQVTAFNYTLTGHGIRHSFNISK